MNRFAVTAVFVLCSAFSHSYAQTLPVWVWPSARTDWDSEPWESPPGSLWRKRWHCPCSCSPAPHSSPSSVCCPRGVVDSRPC